MINHIGGFAVKDIERSIQFYESVLAPLGYKKKIAILSKQLSTHEFIKNKLQGIKAYLSIIEKSSSL